MSRQSGSRQRDLEMLGTVSGPESEEEASVKGKEDWTDTAGRQAGRQAGRSKMYPGDADKDAQREASDSGEAHCFESVVVIK